MSDTTDDLVRRLEHPDLIDADWEYHRDVTGKAAAKIREQAERIEGLEGELRDCAGTGLDFGGKMVSERLKNKSMEAVVTAAMEWRKNPTNPNKLALQYAIDKLDKANE